MTQPAIIVDGISKRYRLGNQASPHQTFREMATGMVTAPFRKLRAAGHGGNEGEDFWALKDVSFEVQPGEVVGIIGRNGAGKSTLLKILSRITEPTDGRIRMRGRVASLLEVGTGFHPELTGRENIYLNGAILGMKRAEITKKFDEIVAFAETEKFLDTPVKRYSSGMYVRLAFAVAAHLEPEILIVDEVLSVGDAEFQKKCLGKMQDVATGEGRTVLFVSHNLAAVQALCSRGVILNHGKLALDSTGGNAATIYLKSLNNNRLEDFGKIDQRRGRGQVRVEDLRLYGPNGDASDWATGKPAAVEFSLKGASREIQLIFAIYDGFGNLVADFDTQYRCCEDTPTVKSNSGQRQIRCDIPELTLAPGRYRMNIALLCCGELQDHIEGAVAIDVHGGLLGSRLVPTQTRGTTVIRHCWTLPS